MRGRDLVAVVASGLLILLSFIAIGVLSPTLGSPTHIVLVSIAAAAYCTAMAVVLASRPHPSRRVLVGCLLLAVALRVPLWMTGPGRDAYRYVWDARVARAGYNPYVVKPSDPALASLHTDETRLINNPDLPTPYPPGAQLLFRAVYLFSSKAYAFKIALAVCDVLLGLVLWRWVLFREAPRIWVLAYAWSPLVILATAGEAHIDLAGALCLLTSATLLLANRRLSSAVVFALAVAIKPLPIVLLPLYWRRVRLIDAAVAAVVLGVLYLPYTDGWHVPVGSLGAFIAGFRFNAPVFLVTSAVLGVRGATAVAIAAGLLAAFVLQARRGVATPSTWAWPMAVALLASPVVYPWYLVWLMPFVTSVGGVPLVAWSVSILCTYRVWHAAQLGAGWVVPPSMLVLEFGVVAVVAASVLRWRSAWSLR